MSLFAELKRRNVIRVAVMYAVFAWVVIQLADLLFPLFDIPEWATRFVVVLLLLGFAAAVLFSWVFELTPDGLKREREISRDQSVTAHTAKKLDFITISLVVLALGVFGYSQVGKQDTRGSDNEVVRTSARPANLSIAVLPFVNMSADTENEFFADGLSEELLNVLAKIEDFKVAGRTSSFAFKGKSDDFKTIGKALNVNTILEGSVRKSGDTVRVTAQLIDVNDGYHLWSDTYDRKLDNIFQIQDEIATQVVTALKQELLGEADLAVIAKKGTDDIEAHQHYLKGLHHVAYRSKEQLELALSEFKEAARLDPGYALAHTGIAYAYVQLAGYGYRSIAEVGPLAELELGKAFAIDDELSEAWAIKGTLAGNMGVPLSETVPMLERAIELNPNHAYAHMWLAGSLWGSDPERMQTLYQKAYELDPLAPVIVQNMASMNAFRNQMDEAMVYANRLKEIAPDWDGTYRTLATIAFTRGDVQAEVRWNNKVLELDPENIGTYESLADIYTDLGDLNMAQQLIDMGRRINPAYAGLASADAKIMLLRGDKSAAVDMMRGMVRKWPEDMDLLQNTAMVEYWAGNLPEAKALLMTSFGFADYPDEWIVDSNNGFITPMLAYVIYELGDTDQATALSLATQEFFESVRSVGTKCWCTDAIAAYSAAAVRDRATTLEWLQISMDQAVSRWPWSFYGPSLEFLKDDPEFVAITENINQRKNIVLAALADEKLLSDTMLAETGLD